MAKKVFRTSSAKATKGERQKSVVIALLIATFVYFRLSNVSYPFSFDYAPYLWIIRRIGDLSYSEILDPTYGIPYTDIGGIIRVEFGFSFLVKTLYFLSQSPAVIYSVIASSSVAIRVYVMKTLGVPLPWILSINLLTITLMEANALRFGIATSFLILSLRQFKFRSNMSATLFAIISVTLHLQTGIFLIFAALAFLGGGVFKKSPLWVISSIAIAGLAAISVAILLTLSSNEKVQEYVYSGSSTSSGLSLTSMLALVMMLTSAYFLISARSRQPDARMFYTITFACLPSVMIFIFVTNIAVIGDRLWQMTFVVFSSFAFTQWVEKYKRTVVLFNMAILLIVMQVNVLIRFPLSNFFSPPFPVVQNVNEPFAVD